MWDWVEVQSIANSLGWDQINEGERTLMQYADIKDMEGAEIYEGDIVALTYAPLATAKGRVKFERGAFYFKTTEAEPNICLLHELGEENSLRVIGNIYQNPELLNITR